MNDFSEDIGQWAVGSEEINTAHYPLPTFIVSGVAHGMNDSIDILGDPGSWRELATRMGEKVQPEMADAKFPMFCFYLNEKLKDDKNKDEIIQRVINYRVNTISDARIAGCGRWSFAFARDGGVLSLRPSTRRRSAWLSVAR